MPSPKMKGSSITTMAFEMHPALRITIVTCALLACAAVVFARFQPPNEVTWPFFQKFADTSIYALYDQLDQSIVPNSSLLMFVAEAFAVDLSHPAALVLLYSVAVLVGGWAVYRIARDVLHLDVVASVLLLTVMLYADQRLYVHSHISWAPAHNGSVTAPAVGLRLLALYFLFRWKPFAVAMTLMIVNAISLKTGWVATGIFLLMCLVHEQRSWKTFLAVGLALLPPAVQILFLRGAEVPPNEAAAVYSFVVEAYRTEDDPWTLKIREIVLLLAGSFISLHVSRNFSANVRLLVRTTLSVSFLVAIMFGAYFAMVGHHFPIPEIVWLSPKRGLETLSIVILIMTAGWFLTTAHLTQIERIIGVVLLCVLSLNPVAPRALLITVFLAVFLGVLSIDRVFFGSYLMRTLRIIPMRNSTSTFLVIGAVLFVAVMGLRRAPPPVTFNSDFGFIHNDHSLDINLLHAISFLPRDRRYTALVPSKNGQDLVRDEDLLRYARQSSYLYSLYYLASAQDLIEERRRQGLVQAVIHFAQQERSIDTETACSLASDNVSFIISRAHDTAFAEWTLQYLSGGWQVVTPPCASRSPNR